MRVLSEKDLTDLKSKGVKVIKKTEDKPKTDGTKNLLSEVYYAIASLAKDVKLQMVSIKNTLAKLTGFIESIPAANTQQAADNELQTQKILSKLDKGKTWRFDVIRNNRGFITGVIASQIKEII